MVPVLRVVKTCPLYGHRFWQTSLWNGLCNPERKTVWQLCVKFPCFSFGPLWLISGWCTFKWLSRFVAWTFTKSHATLEYSTNVPFLHAGILKCYWRKWESPVGLLAKQQNESLGGEKRIVLDYCPLTFCCLPGGLPWKIAMNTSLSKAQTSPRSFWQNSFLHSQWVNCWRCRWVIV